MKILYLDCSMGAAGDMLLASLSEHLDDQKSFIQSLNSLGLTGVEARLVKTQKQGVTGSQVKVTVLGLEEGLDGQGHDHDHEHDHDHSHNHYHAHDHLHDHYHDHYHNHTHENEDSHSHEAGHEHSSLGYVTAIINTLPVSDRVKKDAINIYRLIAEAEAKAHDKPVELVHFHEVGALDAICDITGVCMLIERLSPDRIVASPLNLGGGLVRCAHGLLSVPAPAVAELVKGLPSYGSNIKGELLTPTGAALLKYYVNEFGPMPQLRLISTGMGMGTKYFDRLNCLRSFLGEAQTTDYKIAELSCNLDDMTGEEMGYALTKLMESGALDAFYSPIQMKKNRPAYMLTVLCKPDEADKYAELMFKHTTTLGIRKKYCQRYELSRRVETVLTPYGEARIKNGKYEYEDLKRIAEETGKSLLELKKELHI